MQANKILGERHYKAGYIVRREMVDGSDFGSSEFEMKSAFTPSGDYIGNPRIAYRLCKKLGIKPEKASPDNNVCSIGFSEADQKWYGWSHRAICGFGIGDIVQKGDCTASSGWTDEYLALHPEADESLPVGFQAATLADARQMAVAFAASVG